ncbi:MAG TPA: acyl-CoA synthetase, partial [Novosphingobium sp.]|nr:acyl-CoA synthetase [Novosphingobium sp.]
SAESGHTLTYAGLDRLANQGAHLLRALGLARGDVLAVMLDNDCAAFAIAWAAERAGLYLTSISTRLSLADAAYILADCEAQALVVSDRLAGFGADVARTRPGLPAFTLGAPAAGLASWMAAIAPLPTTPIADESSGTDMLYSSGTTGRPKGVKPALPTGDPGAPTPLVAMGRQLYGMGEETVYLSTSPLYHAAPLRWAMTVMRLGGTVIVMEKFDAEAALRLIARYRVTHGTWVPTHFVRLLALPEAVRRRHDLSSLARAIHAGAPCPVPVKQAMIDWWGPIIDEYYSGTEMCGITALDAREWLERPGSVGKAVLGRLHILDDDGRELPCGTPGNVYFSDGPAFAYHRDPAKTAAAHNEKGWATLGDIGKVDEAGYLYLTDRKNFMIISGGVNIYPQEIENCLLTHPLVADAAVVGCPDPEMGECAVAVIQLAPEAVAGPHTTADIRDFLRARLGGVKTPRRFEFRAELPREPTGKLLKAALVAEFRGRTSQQP